MHPQLLMALQTLLGQHPQQLGPTVGHPIQNAQDHANLSQKSAHRQLSVGGPGLQYNVPVQQQTYNQPQMGFGPQVQNQLPLHGMVQGGAQTPWQNFSGRPQNYANPQVNDNGFFYN